MARHVVGDFMTDHAGKLGFIVRCLKQAAFHEKISARQSECVDFLGIEHGDMQGNVQVRMLRNALRHRVHVVLDFLVVEVVRHQAAHFHLFDNVLAGLDVLFLPGGDFAKADVLGVAPAALVVGAVVDLREDPAAFRGPLLDELQFGLHVIVRGGDAVIGKHLRFGFFCAEVLDVAVEVMAFVVVRFGAHELQLFLLAVQLLAIFLGAGLEGAHTGLAALFERLFLGGVFRGAEFEMRRELEEVEIRLAQIAMQRAAGIACERARVGLRLGLRRGRLRGRRDGEKN